MRAKRKTFKSWLTRSLVAGLVAIPIQFVTYTQPAQAAVSGSLYLNNASLSHVFDSNLDIGTGQFTIEMWIKPVGQKGQPLWGSNVSGARTFGADTGLGNSCYASNMLAVFTQGVSCGYSTSAGTFVQQTAGNETWMHVVWQRGASNSESIYVNGTRLLNQTNTENLGLNAGPLKIGSSERGAFTGYITNVRLVKDTAIYSGASFTPPSAALSIVTGTKLLLSATDSATALNDTSGNSLNMSVDGTNSIGSTVANTPQGGVTWSNETPFTPPPVYAQGSLVFDRANNANVSTVVAQAPGTGPFTYEAWFKTTAPALSGNINQCIFGTRGSGGASNNYQGSGFDLCLYNARWTYGTDSTTLITQTTNTNKDTWYHIAIVRNSSSIVTLYLNGRNIGSSTDNRNLTSRGLTIGDKFNANAEGFTGLISDVRYSNVEIYTANFRPSSNPLASSVNTKLLLENPELDSSASSLALTRFGTSTVTGTNPFPFSGYPVVNYSYNGATGGNTTVDSVYEGTAISLPAPTKTNSTFMGWFATDDITGSRVPSSYTPTSDITLYAQWSSDSVPVNFNTDGGSFVAGSSVVIGSAIQSAPTPPTKAGYSFAGWKATAGGSAVTFPYYPVLSQQNQLPDPALSDRGIYQNKGLYSSATSYISNFVTVSPATNPTTYRYTTADVMTFTNGLKYMAVRPSTNASLDINNLPNGYYFVPLASSTTLTAIWTRAEFSLTFNSQRGTSVASQTFSSSVSVVRPEDPTRYGYKFNGWSTATSGEVVRFPYVPASLADTTLYAQWQQKSLVGINTAQLVNPTVITPNGTDQTLISTRAASGNVARTRTIINYYDGALPSSYDVSVYTLPDNSFATEQLGSDKSYIISQVVAWKDRVNGDVTDTVVRKEIEMTIESTEIKSGAKVYAIVDGVSTLLATATADGSVTVKFATDPVIVVAAAPLAPASPPSSGGAGGSISSPVPTSTPLPVLTFAKSFNILGFNPGSWTLTKSIKKSIDAFFKSINKPNKISCVGYTTGPTILRSDYNLAMRRGQEVCRYIGAKNPTIAHVITKGTTTKISSDFYRRTKVTVTN